jgi:hypothetical protein
MKILHPIWQRKAPSDLFFPLELQQQQFSELESPTISGQNNPCKTNSFQREAYLPTKTAAALIK